jgi:hypothetical protein
VLRAQYLIIIFFWCFERSSAERITLSLNLIILIYRSTLFLSVSRRVFDNHSSNEFLTRLHLITYSNYCHIISRRGFRIERIVLRTFTSSKSLIKALDSLDISSSTAKQYSFKRRWLIFGQCENNFWVIDSNKSTSSKSWVISLKRMQSKSAEDLCVVESGETMTHTFLSAKRITLDKEKDYTYFRVSQILFKSFHYFLQTSKTLKRSLVKKLLMYIKKNKSFSSWKMIKEKSYKFDIASIIITEFL